MIKIENKELKETKRKSVGWTALKQFRFDFTISRLKQTHQFFKKNQKNRNNKKKIVKILIQ